MPLIRSFKAVKKTYNAKKLPQLSMIGHRHILSCIWLHHQYFMCAGSGAHRQTTVCVREEFEGVLTDTEVNL